jgi:hypothetical protein
MAGIYTAAKRIGPVNTDQVLYKGTENAQISSDFGTLTRTGLEQESAAGDTARFGGVQDRAEETTHTTKSLLFAEFQGLSDVDNDASRSNSST